MEAAVSEKPRATNDGFADAHLCGGDGQSRQRGGNCDLFIFFFWKIVFAAFLASWLFCLEAVPQVVFVSLAIY